MTVRFTCTACRTVMKLDSAVNEERKVRCTGCRIVILLTPDPDEPDGMRVSIPKKSDKPKGTDSRQRNLMLGALAIMAIIVAVGLYIALFSGPKTYATVDGVITLDGNLMEKGTIEFETVDTPKPIIATAGIRHG